MQSSIMRVTISCRYCIVFEEKLLFLVLHCDQIIIIIATTIPVKEVTRSCPFIVCLCMREQDNSKVADDLGDIHRSMDFEGGGNMINV